MDYILYALIFCIGTVFGSFFTLAVYRIPLKQDITHTRSYCPNCNHKLQFLDMIPILSYVFLGGKCRYCKDKIRPRYVLLEILSGLVFLLFAISINFNIFSIYNSQILIYFIFGILYIVTMFIIAGIDKERIEISKPVLLFGFICVTIYIIYLYIVQKDPSIYRYVIYLLLASISVWLDTIILRKKGKDSYAAEIFSLAMLMVSFTYEPIYILTAILTLIAIALKCIVNKVHKKKSKAVKNVKEPTVQIPVGFYMCTANIIVLIITNFLIFS